MSLQGILLYTFRALAVALPVTLIYFSFRHVVFKKYKRSVQVKQELLLLMYVLYLCALISITAIRKGEHLLDWWQISHTLDTVQLIPIVTTLQQIPNGAWAVIYPIGGNLVWFLPFGFFLALRRKFCLLRTVIAASAGLSVSIEILQWILLSGVSDIDDVIFNVLGAVLGYALYRMLALDETDRRSIKR